MECEVRSEKEQAMKSRRPPKQVANPPAVVDPPCESNSPTAVGPPAPIAASTAPTPPRGAGGPRLRVPNRQQPLSSKTIDELLDSDHPARAVWAYVLKLDLTPLYDRIRARDSVAGRPAIDPALLVALWLYAHLSGFSSARELADLCVHHDAFKWLAGGLFVNYHTLADFHTDNVAFLNNLFKQSVDVLRQHSRVDLDRVAQDGVRVRASAGADSFRRRQTLEKLLEEAQAEVHRLQQKRDTGPTDLPVDQDVRAEQTCADARPSPQHEASAMRHAQERTERIEAALERMPQMEEKIPPGEKKEARVSTTDPDATVMKMADGGFRPAYNVEFGTTCRDQVIVGVDVVTTGSDQGQMLPMLDQIEERFEQRPKEVLADGGFVKLDDIANAQAVGGCKVYMPVPKPKNDTVDRYEPKATDSKEVAQWRTRMGTQEAHDIYKERAATAECVNAQARNRGLRQFLVRGLGKVKSVALWYATAHNMARCFALLPQLTATGCT
jgi:transposase